MASKSLLFRIVSGNDEEVVAIEDVDPTSAFIRAVDYAGTKYAWGTWGVEALAPRASLARPSTPWPRWVGGRARTKLARLLAVMTPSPSGKGG